MPEVTGESPAAAVPGLSVVVPTLGRPGPLYRCLAALAAQQIDEPYEVIVVHNGRPRDWQPLASLALPARSPWCDIHPCVEPVRSVGLARNRGLALARANLVAFTDDDCVVPATWASDLIGFMRLRPDVVCAGGLVVEPERPGPIYHFMRRINYMHSGHTFKIRPGGIPSLGCANLFARRDVLLSLSGFNAELVSSEDFELLVRLRRAGMQSALNDQAPAVVHCHETSLAGFIRRYHHYGQGVAQTVRLHNLDPETHRVYVHGQGRLDLLRAARRFAREDLASHPLPPGSNLAVHATDALLALLRAVAWQRGAQGILWHRPHRPVAAEIKP